MVQRLDRPIIIGVRDPACKEWDWRRALMDSNAHAAFWLCQEDNLQPFEIDDDSYSSPGSTERTDSWETDSTVGLYDHHGIPSPSPVRPRPLPKKPFVNGAPGLHPFVNSAPVPPPGCDLDEDSARGAREDPLDGVRVVDYVPPAPCDPDAADSDTADAGEHERGASCSAVRDVEVSVAPVVAPGVEAQ